MPSDDPRFDAYLLHGVTAAATDMREARTRLNDAVRNAHTAGIPERQITKASGLANMTVRRILGKTARYTAASA